MQQQFLQQIDDVNVVSNSSKSQRQCQRDNVAYARTIIMFIIEYLVGTNLALKTIVLEKLFSHPLLKDVLPPYLQDLQKVKTNQNLIDNLRSSLISHLVGAKSSKITMAKDIVCTLAIF